MKYTKFREYLRESEYDDLSPERRQELDELFLELTDEEIDHLGQILFSYFSDEDEDEDEEEYPEGIRCEISINAIGSFLRRLILFLIRKLKHLRIFLMKLILL